MSLNRLRTWGSYQSGDIFTLLVFPQSSFLSGREVVDFSRCMWEVQPIFLPSGHPIVGPTGTNAQDPGVLGRIGDGTRET